MLGSRDPYVVAFDGPDDPDHPHNYPTWKKLYIVHLLVLLPYRYPWISNVFSSKC